MLHRPDRPADGSPPRAVKDRSVTKPVVLIAEELSPATIDALGPDFEVRHCDGANRDELLPALADVDAVLVRSATQIDEEALAAAPRLKVVARAGVGLDNVDVKAATVGRRHGRQRPAPPTSSPPPSSPSACCSRRRATSRRPTQALKGGAWKRSKYTGVELLDKTVGHRRAGPDRRARRRAARGVRHEGRGLRPLRQRGARRPARRAAAVARRAAGAERLHHRPPAQDRRDRRPDRRGGAEAGQARRCGSSTPRAAGSSTSRRWPTPCTRAGWPAPASTSTPRSRAPTRRCSRFESVVATPHLGASTDEAQEKAGVAVARSVRLALAGELVPDAVNVPGGVIAEEVRPGIPLAEKLGRIFTALAGAVPAQIDIDVRGEITAARRQRLASSPPSRACSRTSSRSRCPTSTRRSSPRSGAARCACSPSRSARTSATSPRCAAPWPTASVVSVAGTLTGPRLVEKVVAVNGFDLEVPISEHMAFFRYVDRPGIIGIVGPGARRRGRQHRRHAGRARPPGRRRRWSC